MGDIVEDMIAADILTGNSAHTYQSFIQVAKFFLQLLNTLNIIEDVDEEKAEPRKPGISYYNDGNLLSSWVEQKQILVSFTSDCYQKPMKNHPCNTPFFYRTKRKFLRESYGLN